MSDKGNTRIVALGDLHWGAVPPGELQEELDSVLFPWLEANEFDALVQLGDWFHRRLDLDGADAKAAMWTVVRLCQLCQSRGVPFRIVKGTISHDYTQLANYRPLETEYPVFRVVTTAMHEELLPGFDVLWMPEEYPTNYDDFYRPFLFGEDGSVFVYDAIFGHGELDVAVKWSEASEGERHYGGTPCHSAESLLGHASGPVWFGHVHVMVRYKKRLGYPGSFTRWCHGEEQPKGFDVLDVGPARGTSRTVRVSQVPNAAAPLHSAVRAMGFLDPTDGPDAIVAKIRERAAAVRRLRVDLGEFPLGIEELSLVRGAFASDPSVEIRSAARPPSVSTGGTEEQEEETAAGSKLDYLRDPTVSVESRLLRYMNETDPERSAGITEDEVRELTAPLA
jgi:hypothetical protein